MIKRMTLHAWAVSNGKADLLRYLVDRTIADKYGYNSHEKVQWCCDKGHRFERSICNFVNSYNKDGFNCPYCNGRRIAVGYNDLATTHPSLAEEWCFEQNSFKPTEITAGSHKDAFWKCKYGHVWKARISARVHGNGCPYCSRFKRSSIPEQVLFYYVKKHFPDAISRHKIAGLEADVYVPCLGVAIEYDGSFWHSDTDHSNKAKLFGNHGVVLYTISGIPTLKGNGIFAYNDNLNCGDAFSDGYFTCVNAVLNRLGVFDETFSDIKSALVFAKDNYYASCNAGVEITDSMRSMWSPLNGYPVELVSNDNKSKLWVCENGHTFTRRLDVFNRSSSCPFCASVSPCRFRLYALALTDTAVVILDSDTFEVEERPIDYIISCIRDSGINIRGLFLRCGSIVKDNSYFSAMSNSNIGRVFSSNFAWDIKCITPELAYSVYIAGALKWVLLNTSLRRRGSALSTLFNTGSIDSFASKEEVLNCMQENRAAYNSVRAQQEV